MKMLTSQVEEFLRARGFQRVNELITILDVPPWTFTNGDIEVDLAVDGDWAYLDLLGPVWGNQRGGAPLFEELLTWARANNLIVSE